MFWVFQIPQLAGERFLALAALLGVFGLAALPLTYLLSFLFQARPASRHLLRVSLAG